jgi:hypothetical protein
MDSSTSRCWQPRRRQLRHAPYSSQMHSQSSLQRGGERGGGLPFAKKRDAELRARVTHFHPAVLRRREYILPMSPMPIMPMLWGCAMVSVLCARCSAWMSCRSSAHGQRGQRKDVACKRAAEKLSNARATSAPGRPNVYPAQAKMVHGKFARLQLDNHHEFAKVKH